MAIRDVDPLEIPEIQSPELDERERLQFALSTTPMFVWEWDLETNKVVHLHDDFGMRGDSGGELCQRFHSEDRERLREATARILAGETPGAIDIRFVLPDGQERWGSFRARRRCGADGRPTHLYGVLLDITEHKQVEEEMLAAKAAAEEANRVKDEFLAMLSHELRTPLTPALTLVQMLARDENLAPEHRTIVAEIYSHIGSEVRLINDLLSFERLVHNKVELRLAPVDVHEQARHALAVCDHVIHLKRLAVVESLDAADSVVLGDGFRLRQVVWNLVQNAVKFTPHEGRIVLRTANPEPGVLVLEVEDNGLGIEPGMLEKIFEKFERGGRRPDSLGGLGLGLTLSQRLVEMHGGTLTAASPGHGRGATFTLRLTTASAAGTAGEAQVAETPSAEPSGLDRPLKILFLEDHLSTASAISRLLRSYGHTVRVVHGLVAGERAVEAERFDLLLCDLQLPEGSGLDFLPRARPHLLRWAAGGAEAPAIALSGFARESDVVSSLAAGYVEHLAKPVDQSNLLAAIRRATAHTAPD